MRPPGRSPLAWTFWSLKGALALFLFALLIHSFDPFAESEIHRQWAEKVSKVSDALDPAVPNPVFWLPLNSVPETALGFDSGSLSSQPARMRMRGQYLGLGADNSGSANPEYLLATPLNERPFSGETLAFGFIMPPQISAGYRNLILLSNPGVFHSNPRLGLYYNLEKRLFHLDASAGKVNMEAAELEVGRYYHVALVLKPEGNEVALYLDGVLTNQGPFGHPYPLDGASLLVLSGGQEALGIDGMLLNQVGLWSRALTPKEIGALAQSAVKVKHWLAPSALVWGLRALVAIFLCFLCLPLFRRFLDPTTKPLETPALVSPTPKGWGAPWKCSWFLALHLSLALSYFAYLYPLHFIPSDEMAFAEETDRLVQCFHQEGWGLCRPLIPSRGIYTKPTLFYLAAWVQVLIGELLGFTSLDSIGFLNLLLFGFAGFWIHRLFVRAFGSPWLFWWALLGFYYTSLTLIAGLTWWGYTGIKLFFTLGFGVNLFGFAQLVRARAWPLKTAPIGPLALRAGLACVFGLAAFFTHVSAWPYVGGVGLAAGFGSLFKGIGKGVSRKQLQANLGVTLALLIPGLICLAGVVGINEFSKGGTGSGYVEAFERNIEFTLQAVAQLGIQKDPIYHFQVPLYFWFFERPALILLLAGVLIFPLVFRQPRPRVPLFAGGGLLVLAMAFAALSISMSPSLKLLRTFSSTYLGIALLLTGLYFGIWQSANTARAQGRRGQTRLALLVCGLLIGWVGYTQMTNFLQFNQQQFGLLNWLDQRRGVDTGSLLTGAPKHQLHILTQNQWPVYLDLATAPNQFYTYYLPKHLGESYLTIDHDLTEARQTAQPGDLLLSWEPLEDQSYLNLLESRRVAPNSWHQFANYEHELYEIRDLNARILNRVSLAPTKVELYLYAFQ